RAAERRISLHRLALARDGARRRGRAGCARHHPRPRRGLAAPSRAQARPAALHGGAGELLHAGRSGPHHRGTDAAAADGARGGPPEPGLQDLLLEAARAERPRSPRSEVPPEKRARVKFAEPRTGGLQREELPGGGVLLIKEERAVPLVALRAAWQGGLRAEDAD